MAIISVSATMVAAALLTSNSACTGGTDDPDEEIRRQGKMLFRLTPTEMPEISSGRLGAMAHISVTRFDVPFDNPRDIVAAWSMLSVKGLETSALTNLNINGMAIGQGSLRSSGRLIKLLTELGAKRQPKILVTTIQYAPTSIRLGQHPEGCTVFTTRPDMTLTGVDHPPGNSRLMISCGPAAGMGGRTELTFLPQIQSRKLKSNYVKDASGYAHRLEPETTSFYNLIWKTSLSSKDFLMLGPSMNAVSPTSPGNTFLIKDVNGKRFATLLLFYVNDSSDRTARR